jgi:hypothetical protein
VAFHGSTPRRLRVNVGMGCACLQQTAEIPLYLAPKE